MIFVSRQEPFICEHCDYDVQPLLHGTCRSHCPKCLWSKHVDIEPGDRASICQGMMEPMGLEQSGKKGFVIMHKCTKCGIQKRNKAAEEDDLTVLSSR